MNKTRGGWSLSLETRQKISEGMKGKKNSLGHHQSPEHRRKISEAHRGKKAYNWKGGRKYDSNGYVRILRPNHPRSSWGYVYEHILVLEKRLGRPLLLGEVAHHANGIKDDNRPENIAVFRSNAEHLAYHKRLKKIQKGGTIW